jgi:putative alpha-1,2-mannosidase
MPDRGAGFVRSLLSIYRHDKYLPDARSGHSNGRTQGGSYADIVIADAWLKGLPGIDWDLALDAVLQDADVKTEMLEKPVPGLSEIDRTHAYLLDSGDIE